MRLKRALSQIKPNEGQREKIYGDILDRLDKLSGETSVIEKETRFVMKKRKIFTAAAVCALVLACGLTVSAANFGWGHKLFGSSAAVIERDLYDYSVEIGNVRIEKAEDVPYNFTVGDVISDGGSVYFNLLVEGITTEPYWARPSYQTSSFGLGSNGWQSNYYWLGMDGDTANIAVCINCANEIKKGDVIEFELRGHDNDETDENGEVVITPTPPLIAALSFEIQSEVNDARKTIEINRTAIFKDRPEPAFAEVAPYDEDKLLAVEMYVKTISVSPLNYVIKGTADLSQPVVGSNFAHGWGNVWFVLKNGERVCLQADYMGSDSAAGEYVISMIANFSPKRGLIDLNEIEAIEFDGFTVPFNSGEAAE